MLWCYGPLQLKTVSSIVICRHLWIFLFFYFFKGKIKNLISVCLDLNYSVPAGVNGGYFRKKATTHTHTENRDHMINMSLIMQLIICNDALKYNKGEQLQESKEGNKRKTWIFGEVGDGVWPESEENDFQILPGVPPFRGLCWLCYYSFSVYLFFFSWLSFTVIKRCNFWAFILLLGEIWSQLLEPCVECGLSTRVADKVLLQKGLTCKTYIYVWGG